MLWTARDSFSPAPSLGAVGPSRVGDATPPGFRSGTVGISGCPDPSAGTSRRRQPTAAGELPRRLGAAWCTGARRWGSAAEGSNHARGQRRAGPVSYSVPRLHRHGAQVPLVAAPPPLARAPRPQVASRGASSRRRLRRRPPRRPPLHQGCPKRCDEPIKPSPSPPPAGRASRAGKPCLIGTDGRGRTLPNRLRATAESCAAPFRRARAVCQWRRRCLLSRLGLSWPEASARNTGPGPRSETHASVAPWPTLV